jgi:protoporphyrinogen oxidase
LTNGNQNKNIITSFWEILCAGALNTNLEKASALVFYEVLMQIFFKGNFASTIILPMFGLSKSFILPAEEFIRNNNGQIILSETVKEIRIINQKITEVKTDKNIFDNYDFVISAIPLLALEKIVPKEILKVDVEFDYSTILNVHIWLDENNFEEKFYGLLDSPLHWIFVKEKHINIVISDADYLADKSKQEILDFVTDELRHYTSIKKDDIVNYKVIKEKRATFIPDIDTLEKRPNNKTTINNLYLAGDWIDTGLPSTIESAVKSGRMAAEMILTENKNY